MINCFIGKHTMVQPVYNIIVSHIKYIHVTQINNSKVNFKNLLVIY